MLREFYNQFAESGKEEKKGKRKKSIDGGKIFLKKKKMRTTFTGKQIFELERSFEAKKYLSSAERAELALSLAVTQQQVCPLARLYFNFH